MLFYGCAKIAGPGGGPEDKTPPQILMVKPIPGSVGVPLETQVEIIFSKNMNNQATQKAIFISPIFFNFPQYEWSGKKLKIKLPEKLRQNTTYSITIGASATDLRNNQLGQSRSFSFSTGDHINTGSISGQAVLGALRGLDIWAYKLDSLPPDSFMYRIPDYITQSDSLGVFRFDFLNKGKYLIIGVEDKNKDQFWTPPSEKLALPDKMIELADDSSVSKGLTMVAVEQDTARPILSKVTSPNKNMIVIEFSHRLKESSLVRADAFSILPVDDSTAQIFIMRIYPIFGKDKTITIDCAGLEVDHKYRLMGRGLESIYSVKSDSLAQTFTAGREDTTGPTITMIMPNPSANPIASGNNIILAFSETIDTAQTDRMIILADTFKTTLPVKMSWDYPDRLVIKSEMKPGMVYVLTVNQKLVVDMQGNAMGDSVITYRYSIAPEDTFGQISGQIMNARPGNIIVIAQPIKADSVTTIVSTESKFIFNRLFPVVYHLIAFVDLDQDGKYSPGRTNPFRFAEPVAIYPDSIIVRSRWETDIGWLDFEQSSK